jgi:hypothetical protein
VSETTYYLHTINDCPAFFDGEQICFAGGATSRSPQRLCRSLRQIRREQSASVRNRKRWGFEAGSDQIGYVRVHLPEAPR